MTQILSVQGLRIESTRSLLSVKTLRLFQSSHAEILRSFRRLFELKETRPCKSLAVRNSLYPNNFSFAEILLLNKGEEQRAIKPAWPVYGEARFSLAKIQPCSYKNNLRHF